jgi:hypothetical protein
MSEAVGDPLASGIHEVGLDGILRIQLGSFDRQHEENLFEYG